MQPDQPSNSMIKVDWPMGALVDDMVVCNWLDDLVADDPRQLVFEFRHPDEIYFAREDDAVAFRLRFGL